MNPKKRSADGPLPNWVCCSICFTTNTLNQIVMGNLLYIVAVILVIAWLIGFVGYQAGGIIHILLVIAIIAVLLRVIQGRRV